MSLRQQLTDILPEILPANPKEATKGTELIRLVRLRLEGEYSDASLRYHFSIMSCDPSSPIAKVEKGQGYYRRSAPVPALAGAQDLLSMTQGRLEDLAGSQVEVDLALERARKFRAIASRYCEVNERFPFNFREVLSKDAPMGNLWKYPDMVVVDWELGEPADNAVSLDHETLELKRRLAIPPFRLRSVLLRLLPNLELFREEFFQAVSVSQWTHGGELYYGAPIEDEALSEQLRHLANEFGVGITTFGLTPEMLDDLPSAEHILTARPRETDALMERLEVRRLALPRLRDHVDWTTLNSIRNENAEVQKLFSWLGTCVANERAVPFVEG